jgi:hypothetical protein
MQVHYHFSQRVLILACMLQAPDEVGDVGDYMIRFKPHKRAILEVTLNILVTPTTPAQWQLRCGAAVRMQTCQQIITKWQFSFQELTVARYCWRHSMDMCMLVYCETHRLDFRVLLMFP